MLSTKAEKKSASFRVYALLGATALAWWVAYTLLQPLAELVTFDLLGFSRESPLGQAIAFFLYDVPKILLLLGGMIFLITIVRTFFSAERHPQCVTNPSTAPAIKCANKAPPYHCNLSGADHPNRRGIAARSGWLIISTYRTETPTALLRVVTRKILTRVTAVPKLAPIAGPII